MSDIVERLRNWSDGPDNEALVQQAADEIERLRALLRQALDVLEVWSDASCNPKGRSVIAAIRERLGGGRDE